MTDEVAQPKVYGILHFDGACSPNPGAASGGFVLTFGTRRIVRTESFGYGTVNTAEYSALIIGLKTALQNGVTNIEVYGDSQLVVWGVTNMKRRYKGKPHLLVLKEQAIALLEKFQSASVDWLPRHENAEADEVSSAGDSRGIRSGSRTRSWRQDPPTPH